MNHIKRQNRHGRIGFLGFACHWIRTNRFPHRPYFIKSKWGVSIKFANINCVTVHMREDGEFSIWAKYDMAHHHLCDWIGDFDVPTERDKRGLYYSPIHTKRVYFRHKEDLWKMELKSFFRWCIEHLKSHQYVYFVVYGGGSHHAKIGSYDEMKKGESEAQRDGNMFVSLPIVKNEEMQVCPNSIQEITK